ncbi:MAG: GNAT family protein [Chloroflexota bacterium]|nr:GNAT family protein [Chloroflexota bacterium]
MSIDDTFQVFPQFSSARLHLRRITSADLDALYALYKQPDVGVYTNTATFTDPVEARFMLAYFDKEYSWRHQIRWGIIERATETLIGTCCLFDFDWQHHHAEIGYDLSVSHWGQGIMSEALLPVLDYGFDTLDLHRIEARLTPENSASSRLLERLGFSHEGTLKERFYSHGRFWDDAFYGLLRSTYRQRRSASGK